ncbi:FecR family protein [Chitinophaga deserti]|uniref:FecR family protein n=1 Tax=Chitinophaga deserti TaxID=2164099 RepID=UPI000D6BBFAB|nr:FecR family protein [Chitinophaga deserti]
MMNQDELLGVMERVADGTATGDDLQLYNDWCNAMQAGKQDGIHPSFPEKSEAIFRSIESRVRHNRNIRYRKWTAAAASLLLLISIGAAFWLKQHSSSPSSNAAGNMADSTIRPGSSGAVLVLADGSEVELGAQQKGQIGEQDGSRINKSSDSGLVYVFNGQGSEAGTVQYNTLITPNGKQFQVQLPDGTKIWINAGSSLRFPVNFDNQQNREVQLNGEAYFEVAKDVHKPFVVVTKRERVEVLGTHFNIDSYDGISISKTTLVEGAVRVNRQMELRPGEQAAVQQSGKIDRKSINTANVIAWKNGYFSFAGESIQEIMPRLARWYNLEVVYEAGLPADKMEVSMSRSRSITEVLDYLQSTKLIKFEVNGRRVTVSRY